MSGREIMTAIVRETIAATLPANMVREKLKFAQGVLSIEGKNFVIPEERGVHLFGSGKAAVETARAVKELLGEKLAEGFVVSNYPAFLDGVEVFESSHPVLTQKSVRAAEMLMEKMAALAVEDFFIYVLSGGSSALIEKPVPPISLADMQSLTKGLLAGGVPIEEINIVRKHLSLVKGGRLGRLTRARGVVLVVSDVIGDDLEAIGSGPLYFDRSTFADAQAILKKYRLWEGAPAAIRTVVERGLSGQLEDTPQSENPPIEHFIIDSNIKALLKAKENAERLGLTARIMTSRLRGEAREAARAIVAIGEEIAATGQPFPPPVLLLFGGETTVTLQGDGQGGRNQEMALAVLNELRGASRFAFFSLGTDGIDGNSDAAGAIVSRESWEKAQNLNLNIEQYLSMNDSYHFFEQTGDLVKTGPTGTNVMDISALLING
ncbi:MAG: glycerate kinase [Syntrophobacterales bacterium]|nr:glycerate kinase [Syntrophobacterales bacterium]